MKQYNIRVYFFIFDTWCRLIFYLFLHKIVELRQFHFFNMASKIALKGHVAIFIIFIDLNEGNIYKQYSVKVSQQ